MQANRKKVMFLLIDIHLEANIKFFVIHKMIFVISAFAHLSWSLFLNLKVW